MVFKLHKVEMVNIDDLKFDGDNPNVMTPEQENDLTLNMDEFGFLQPIIIDQDNMVYDGEHRVKIYRKFGKKEIPAYRLNLTDGQRRVLRQVMNKLRGTHDKDLDAAELKRIIELGEGDMLKELLHSQEEEFEELFSRINEREVVEDEVPEVPEKSVIKRGDLVKLGSHRLLCGDATSKEDVERLMN